MEVAVGIDELHWYGPTIEPFVLPVRELFDEHCTTDYCEGFSFIDFVPPGRGIFLGGFHAGSPDRLHEIDEVRQKKEILYNPVNPVYNTQSPITNPQF